MGSLQGAEEDERKSYCCRRPNRGMHTNDVKVSLKVVEWQRVRVLFFIVVAIFLFFVVVVI